MSTIKISLVNMDQVVQATRDLNLADDGGHSMAAFIRQIKEELVPGETGYLQIQGFDKDPVTFAISPCE
ncbi:MAG: hypothetical protein C4576_25000 [Desulfobacteraceae bacterium]|nr:MAG: hypothetical protein C4576_25000 [Desulfobacteraceae bacterium]